MPKVSKTTETDNAAFLVSEFLQWHMNEEGTDASSFWHFQDGKLHYTDGTPSQQVFVLAFASVGVWVDVCGEANEGDNVPTTRRAFIPLHRIREIEYPPPVETASPLG
jgi:hypothetical protein